MFLSRIEEIDNYIRELREFYNDSDEYRFKNPNLINNLDKSELIYLNKNLNLEEIVGCQKRYVLNNLIQDNTKDKFTFYILMAKRFEFEINHFDQTKSTVFIELAKRIFYDNVWGSYLIDSIFQRGYEIKEEDIQFVFSLYKKGVVKDINNFHTWTMLRFAVLFKDRDKFQKSLIKRNEIYTILSFKEKKPIGFNFPNLLGVAINAIQNYRENGDIILKAMDVYDVNKIIYSLDKKKNTFTRKKNEYLKNRHLQDEKFKNIAIEIFPELNTNNS
jgi:hypothetical protein